MKIDTDRFCGLSKRNDFQDWLKSVSVDLYNELMEHLKKSEGCGSNKNKMKIINAKLQSLGKEQALIDFVKNKYPHMIVHDNKSIVKQVEPVKNLKDNELNYHKVFPSYSPNVLMFPQRKILVGSDYISVNNAVISFIRSHIGADYLILKGKEYYHGYIEYFDKKYESIVSQIPMIKRPISIYRANAKNT